MPIRWISELPPPAKRGRKPVKRPKYYAFAQALMKRPGTWAVLGDKLNSSIAHQIKTGQKEAFRPAGAFEAVCRNTQPDGRGTIYVRFVGAEGDDE